MKINSLTTGASTEAGPIKKTTLEALAPFSVPGKLNTYSVPGTEIRFTVRHLPATGEFRVRKFLSGEPVRAADYFTDDVDDARDTALYLLTEETRRASLARRASGEVIPDPVLEVNPETGLFPAPATFALRFPAPSFVIFRKGENTGLDFGFKEANSVEARRFFLKYSGAVGTVLSGTNYGNGDELYDVQFPDGFTLYGVSVLNLFPAPGVVGIKDPSPAPRTVPTASEVVASLPDLSRNGNAEIADSVKEAADRVSGLIDSRGDTEPVRALKLRKALYLLSEIVEELDAEISRSVRTERDLGKTYPGGE